MPAQFDPNKLHRRSIRLEGYDYSQPGAYFVTICTYQREELFGQVKDGRMCPNRLGAIVQSTSCNLPYHYPHVKLDAFCLMPNHVHGILVLVDDDIVSCAKPIIRHALPEIVRAFKSFSARRINTIRRTPGFPVWQRNYYEHIIRNPEKYQGIAD